MDLASCYGKGLQAVPYPVGHPVFLYYSIHRKDTWLKLKDFLKAWGDELEDLCWYAVIDTWGEKLTFDQDLIFYRDLGPKDLSVLDPKAKETDDYTFKADDGHIRGKFMLLLREVNNWDIKILLFTLAQKCVPKPKMGGGSFNINLGPRLR